MATDDVDLHDIDDADIDDGVQNDVDVAYISNSTPWVQQAMTLLTTFHLAPNFKVLGPMHFDELGLSTAEELWHIMKPSERAGSLKRYILRVSTEVEGVTQRTYYIVKEIRIPNGENEVTIGRILRSQVPSHFMLPAIGGFKAQGTDTLQSDFVVVPFKTHTKPLDTFLRNKYPETLQLSTVQVLTAIYLVLKSLNDAYERVEFLHLDCKANQFIVTKSIPLAIYAVDFGCSAIRAVENGNTVEVAPCAALSSTKNFVEEFSLAATVLHDLVAANSPNKNAGLIREWNIQRRRVRLLQIPISELLVWLATVIVDPTTPGPSVTTHTGNV